jgi:NADH-quinone oxidoreductase subunit C
MAPDDDVPGEELPDDATAPDEDATAGAEVESVDGADVAEGEAAPDEPVVVSQEIQPETEEVVDITPEPSEGSERLHGVPVGYSRGQLVLHPTREEYVDVVRRLREVGYLTCLDLCAVDYLGYPALRDLPPGIAAERFEVAVVLMNHSERSRIRLRVQIPEDDPTLPSLVALHPGLDFPEREAFDMFGIRFEGHPDLTRILMPEEWEGHPLRKDEGIGRIPVQFKGAPSGR